MRFQHKTVMRQKVVKSEYHGNEKVDKCSYKLQRLNKIEAYLDLLNSMLWRNRKTRKSKFKQNQHSESYTELRKPNIEQSKLLC